MPGYSDDMIQWKIMDVSGKNPSNLAAFYRGGGKTYDTGREAWVYGVDQGRVAITASFNNPKVAKNQAVGTYDALVVEERKIKFRVQLLRGVDGSVTDFYEHPDLVSKQVQTANVFLRQIGVTLQIDNNSTVYDSPNAKPVDGYKGMFQLDKVPWNWVNRLEVDDKVQPKVGGPLQGVSAANFRPQDDLLIVYLKSFSSANTFGAEFGNPAPRGVFTVKYHILVDLEERRSPRMRQSTAGPLGDPKYGAVFISNSSDFKLEDIWAYGRTLAHEVGHYLTFHHRALGEASPAGLNMRLQYGDDNVNLPKDRNLMSYAIGPDNKFSLDMFKWLGDLDFAQAYIAHPDIAVQNPP